jgi:hypothetical protein
VDRAALDAAISLGIPCGGWCPRGRRAEDGVIPLSYPLKETPNPSYEQRTTWNVRDSDGTLVLARGPLTGGTAYTAATASRLRKPCLVVELTPRLRPEAAAAWAAEARIRTLNVAGPRESQAPGTYALARAFLARLFEQAAPPGG